MTTAKKSPLGRSRVYNLVLVITALSFIFWGCVIVLFPFIPALLWGVILCLTTWPAYEWLREKLNNRPTLSASLMTTLLALCFIAPVLFLINSLADHFAGAKGLVIKVIEKSAGDPPAWIADLPGVGSQLASMWTEHLGSQDALVRAIQKYAEPVSNTLLGAGANVGRGALDLLIGILIAYFFFRHGEAVAKQLRVLLDRFIGERAQRLLDVCKNTMIGVVYGMLGTAFVQGTLVGIGFVIAGIPGAAFWGMLAFFASFLPMGPSIIWIPAAIWLFVESQIGMGLFLIIWGVMVGSIDNIVRPYFIGFGIALPFLLVLLGVFGGIAAFGFIGMFIGPTLLAIAYSLISEWSSSDTPIISAAEKTAPPKKTAAKKKTPAKKKTVKKKPAKA
ncbi:MAG: AI-2E family transporter [Alphaproteobacteria bacterium]|nr:MAG: AI-2E family transporter [Alphaproteobacteria bacterium]